MSTNLYATYTVKGPHGETYTVRPATVNDKENIAVLYSKKFKEKHPEVNADFAATVAGKDIEAFKQEAAANPELRDAFQNSAGRVDRLIVRAGKESTSPLYVVENQQGQIVAFANSNWSYLEDKLMDQTQTATPGFANIRNQLIILDKVYGLTEELEDITRLALLAHQADAIPAQAAKVGFPLDADNLGSYEINYAKDVHQDKKRLEGAFVESPDGTMPPNAIIYNLNSIWRKTGKGDNLETPLVSQKLLELVMFTEKRLNAKGYGMQRLDPQIVVPPPTVVAPSPVATRFIQQPPVQNQALH